MSEILIYIAIGVVLGIGAFFILGRIFRRRYPVVSAEQKSFSEEEVAGFLERAGYQIQGKRQRETVMTRVDGKERFGYVEADFTARRGKRRYVVVVHAGAGPADPNEPMLRRKLLEQDRVFRPHAFLVVDLSRGEIHEVTFYFPHERNIDFFFRFLLAIFIILAVVGIIWVMAQLRLF
jgi:hypothetical protein